MASHQANAEQRPERGEGVSRSGSWAAAGRAGGEHTNVKAPSAPRREAVGAVGREQREREFK